ncbi:3-hydroxyacyl-ACP dehydratase FabZ [Rhodospirillum centenum]|uniref:3-hydroxyacyl-[acyl-carrier-protein] dehydratase FabZ n=1 Tax=Rhodospirillum centenum (strain ATCC 51521 / SW) TaxID=414684 RepID=B6ISU0_RHOCS|nr:3-hydroxyacyl-ACP dehydratase FabZ [Rhodospirillum centenum]ACI98611.1 beta-hydroxyacyl-(acyl-carrier-protein) dehydratase FabZ [Rhodospirillum centenum SW]
MDATAENKTPPQQTVTELDILRIMQMIPHRYPMLLIDKVVDIVTGESCTGIKNVTINEPFFTGHFPARPVMPGVMIVEAMAQTSAVLVMHSLGESAEGRLVYFMTIDEARFRRPIVPGDRIEIKVQKQQNRRNVWRFRGEAWVDGTLCAEAVYAAMIVMDN